MTATKEGQREGQQVHLVTHQDVSIIIHWDIAVLLCLY